MWELMGAAPLAPRGGGRVLLQADHRYLLVEDADGAGGWRRVPDPPGADRTTASTVAWAGDDLVVWGGTQAHEDDGGVTGSTADGWVWRGLGAGTPTS